MSIQKIKCSNDIWYLGVVLTIYLIVNLTLSWLKPFWFDEYFTFYLAQLSIEEMFASLGPMDPHPPLNKLIVSLSQGVFGTTKLATRLPAILFFGVTIVIVYFICKKLIGPKGAKVSSLLLLISIGQIYAYESRPYSLMILLTALLVFLWLKIPTNNNWIYLLLTLTEIALLSTHFYSVFIPVTILFGSCMSYLIKKSIDIKLWISILTGFLVLIIYLPAIQKITVLSDNNWAAPTSELLIKAVRNIYLPFIIVLLPAVINRQSIIGDFRKYFRSNPDFATGLAALSLLVLIGYILSHFLGAFHERYFIASLISCVIVGALIMAHFSREQLFISILLSALIFGYKIYDRIGFHRDKRYQIEELNLLLSEKPPGEPIYISNPKCFLQLLWGKTEQEKKDIHYLVNMSPGGELKKINASEISVYELSKRNPEIMVKNLNEIMSTDSSPYYLLCGRPFSYSVKDLNRLREFRTISTRRKNKLMVGE